MAIKVEVVTPSVSVSDVVGGSTVIDVVRSTSGPISTNGSQAVVDVVKTVSVLNNAVIDSVEPTEPFEGMIWIEIP